MQFDAGSKDDRFDRANAIAKDAVARDRAASLLNDRDRQDLIDLIVDELVMDMSLDPDETLEYAHGELLEDRRIEALEREQWGPHFFDGP